MEKQNKEIEEIIEKVILKMIEIDKTKFKTYFGTKELIEDFKNGELQKRNLTLLKETIKLTIKELDINGLLKSGSKE